MKLFPVAAIVAALALASAVFAQQAAPPAPANKADCEKAKMKWEDKAGKDGKGACVAAAPTKPGDASKK
jgi:Spy/CpxP family protein refolding chaperone